MKKIKSDFLDEIRKRTPIESRLRVLFEMEWLTMNIVPDRQATDDEIQKAIDWSKKMTNIVMEDFNEWEEDGRPKKREE